MQKWFSVLLDPTFEPCVLLVGVSGYSWHDYSGQKDEVGINSLHITLVFICRDDSATQPSVYNGSCGIECYFNDEFLWYFVIQY